ncbi:MAG: VWA domain-containing protein, partial [Planctomycetes bacterium]|nr:VWA domain-containing protein [Planctomycetota bacterium]
GFAGGEDRGIVTGIINTVDVADPAPGVDATIGAMYLEGHLASGLTAEGAITGLSVAGDVTGPIQSVAGNIDALTIGGVLRADVSAAGTAARLGTLEVLGVVGLPGEPASIRSGAGISEILLSADTGDNFVDVVAGSGDLEVLRVAGSLSTNLDASGGTISDVFEVGTGDPQLALWEAIGVGAAKPIDVLVIFDISGSMDAEIEEMARRFGSEVVPGVLSVRPDAAFGVAYYESEVHLVAPITTDTQYVQDALDSLSVYGGTENAYDAFYQMATGEGKQGVPPWPDILQQTLRGRGTDTGDIGGAGFREDSTRILILATDEEMAQSSQATAQDVINALEAIGGWRVLLTSSFNGTLTNVDPIILQEFSDMTPPEWYLDTNGDSTVELPVFVTLPDGTGGSAGNIAQAIVTAIQAIPSAVGVQASLQEMYGLRALSPQDTNVTGFALGEPLDIETTGSEPATIVGGAAVSSGRLSATANFRLHLDTDATYWDIAVQPDSANRSVVDLAEDVRAAVNATLLGQANEITVVVDDDTKGLRFATTDHGSAAWLRLEVLNPNDPAIAELGLAPDANDFGRDATITINGYGNVVSDIQNDGSTVVSLTDGIPTQAEELTAALGWTVGGAPATGDAQLNDLDQNVRSYTDGDRIAIVGTNADGSSVTAVFRYGAGADGTTVDELLQTIDSAMLDATVVMDEAGFVRVVADAAGDAQLSLSLSDDANNRGSTEFRSFIVT